MGRSIVFVTALSGANRGNPSLCYKLMELTFHSFVMRVAAESGSDLMERSKKPGSDPIFGDGISPA